MDTGTFETTNGKVLATFFRHHLGQAKTLEITGIVDGGKLRLDHGQKQASEAGTVGRGSYWNGSATASFQRSSGEAWRYI